MNHPIHQRACCLFPLLTIAIAAVVLAGCSRAGRQARLLEKANHDYAAGEFERAEIEYKNVLQAGDANADAIARLGLIYYAEGREERAIPLLLRARDLQPENLEVRLKLSLAFLANGNFKNARDEAIYVLDRRPRDAEAPLLLVEAAAVDRTELEAARKRLSGLAEPAPHGAPVVVALGVIDLRQGRAAEAEAAFKRAQAADAQSHAAATALGMLYWAQNKVAAADAALKQAAELSPARSSKRLKYAQFKLQTGDAAAAKRLLEEISRATPDYLPAWLWLGEIAARHKKYDDCDAFAAKALARDSGYTDALLLRARTKIARGKAAEAIPDLEKMLGRYPRSPEVAYQLGLAYSATGDSTRAIGMMNRAVSIAPGLDHAVLALAELNMRRRDYTPAIASLRQLIKQRPDLPMARALLAEAYRGDGNFDEAAALYRQLEEQFPKDPQAPFWRGMVLVQQNRRAEARQAFARVRELVPGNFAVIEQLTELDVREQQFQTARQRVEAELAKNPTSLELALLRAKVLFGAGDAAAAEAALRKAADAHANSPLAHFTLAQLYATIHQPEKALASLQRVTTLDPQHVGAHLLTALLQESRHDSSAARDAYEKVLAVDPKNSTALNNLAYIYAGQLNQLDRAQELAQAARELLPNAAETADTLGWVLYRRHDYARALPLLEQAATIVPDNADVQFHLGMATYMMGQEEPARRALGRALQVDAAFASAAEARERLSLLELDAAHPTAETNALLEQALTRRKDDPVALTRMAALYEHDHAWAKALQTQEAIIKSNPANVGAALGAIRLYRRQNDIPRAFELAKAARKQAPGDADVAHALGRLAFDSGDYGWAASLLQEAARKQPADPELLFDLAESLYSTGRVDAAEASIGEALKAKPDFPRAAQARQFLEFCAWSADPAAAAKAAGRIEAALKSNPSDVPALMAMAAACEQRSDTTSAKKYYEKALQRYPDLAPAQKRLALLYAASARDNDKVFEFATKARKAFPDDAELAKVLGLAVLRQGNYARASSLLQESARQRTNDGELMYYLGLAQAQLKRQGEAKHALERALELGLTDELAAQARQSLAKLP